jgi:hypothetical protein
MLSAVLLWDGSCSFVLYQVLSSSVSASPGLLILQVNNVGNLVEITLKVEKRLWTMQVNRGNI